MGSRVGEEKHNVCFDVVTVPVPREFEDRPCNVLHSPYRLVVRVGSVSCFRRRERDLEPLIVSGGSVFYVRKDNVTLILVASLSLYTGKTQPLTILS